MTSSIPEGRLTTFWKCKYADHFEMEDDIQEVKQAAKPQVAPKLM